MKTENEIRAYVDAELRRVKAWYEEHLQSDTDTSLRIEQQEARWYVYVPSAMGDRAYFTIEAYPERQEFFVWYGHWFGAFAPDRQKVPLFSKAVHVYFPDALPDGVTEEFRAHAALGTVLMTMLRDPQEYPPNVVSTTYP